MRDYAKMFMDIACRTAEESNCVKLKVGAVCVRDNRIILQGYNGTISGFVNCCSMGWDLDSEDGKIQHHKWSSAFEIHAEMNILAYAARNGVSLSGTTLYCTHEPCNNCLKHLIQAGVKMVVYKEGYNEPFTLKERSELLKFIYVAKFDCG